MRPRHCWLSGLAMALVGVLVQCSSPPPETVRILAAPGQVNHDAVQAFETFLRDHEGRNVRMSTLLVPAAGLIAALNDGRGDLIADLIMPPEREEPSVAIVPYITGVREVVATGPAEKRVVSLEDLEGRSIHVPKNSRHFASLERLNQQMARINKPGCTIVGLDESLSDEDLLKMVNDGKIPATLVDSHVVAVVKPALGKISVNDDVAVSQDIVVAWAIRKNDRQWLDSLNAFTKVERANPGR